MDHLEESAALSTGNGKRAEGRGRKKKGKSGRNRRRLLSWQFDRFLPVQWMPCYLGWIVRARVERFVANYS